MSAVLIVAQSTGGEASTIWGLLAVVVVVAGGIVTTVLLQRRRNPVVEPAPTPDAAGLLVSIIADLRAELAAKQEQCDRELRAVRERYAIEIRHLQRRLDDCQKRAEGHAS